MLLIKLFWCINLIFTAFVFVEASKDSDICHTKKLFLNFIKDLVSGCLQDFSKCQEGLQGTYDANPCVNEECENEVNEEDSDDDYEYSCDYGYTGKNCKTAVLKCGNTSCINGRCTNDENHNSCSCFAGYTSINCDTDINDCKNNSCPGRECFDLVNGYICSCSGNSNGEHCVKDNLKVIRCWKRARSLDFGNHSFFCPSGCDESSCKIFGTSYYTSNSCICKAAIHDGIIDVKGGEVSLIHYADLNLQKINGSTNNNITSHYKNNRKGGRKFFSFIRTP